MVCAIYCVVIISIFFTALYFDSDHHAQEVMFRRLEKRERENERRRNARIRHEMSQGFIVTGWRP